VHAEWAEGDTGRFNPTTNRPKDKRFHWRLSKAPRVRVVKSPNPTRCPRATTLTRSGTDWFGCSDFSRK
jgi:hypothetical protein